MISIINHLVFSNNDDNNKINFHEIIFFLSSDSLFSLLDQRYLIFWVELINRKMVKIFVDPREMALLGIEKKDFLNQISNFIIFNHNDSLTNSLGGLDANFWENLIEILKIKKFGKSVGFLEFSGPYMSRTSVFVLRFLNSSLNQNLNIELYGYLDGVHLGHKDQKPSEFENIGEGLKRIEYLSNKKNRSFNMLGCSRCGTARGYLKEKGDKEFIQSKDTIDKFFMCNLNKIIEKFKESNIIICPNFGMVQYNDNINNLETTSNYQKPPPIIILITHSPYGSEWTFGGLSFAVACANHQIPTKIVFLENGVYNLIGNHLVEENEKIFNMQDIILATSDMEFLDYYVFDDSLKKRNLDLTKILINEVEKIDKFNLGHLILSNQSELIYHKRIIFF